MKKISHQWECNLEIDCITLKKPRAQSARGFLSTWPVRGIMAMLSVIYIFYDHITSFIQNNSF